jgi:hypothetical protein
MFRFILGGCAVLRYKFGERGTRQIKNVSDNMRLNQSFERIQTHIKIKLSLHQSIYEPL